VANIRLAGPSSMAGTVRWMQVAPVGAVHQTQPTIGSAQLRLTDNSRTSTYWITLRSNARRSMIFVHAAPVPIGSVAGLEDKERGLAVGSSFDWKQFGGALTL
jgi:hypothetical protein